MYDAVTPANIPAAAQMVAGYVDGRYAWRPGDWARFPAAVKVRIAAFSSTNDGTVLDVEAGCSTPANAPGWVTRRRAAGIDPTVYCSLSLWPTVRAAFRAAAVAEPHWWIAAYPGNGPNLYPGAVAHQYANPGPVDISVVADYWPGVDPPAPPTAPEADVPLTQADANLFVHTLLTAKLGSSGPNVAVALQRAATIDPAALASQVAALIPAGAATVTPAQIETALRTVLGSLDNIIPSA